MEFQDWMDEVVMLESKEFEKGKSAGIDEVLTTTEAQTSIISSGFSNGFSIGFEVSFMKTICLKQLEQRANIPQNLMFKLESVIKKAESLPNHNTYSIDFIAELQDLKVLYKKCGSYTKQFQLPSNTETMEW